MSSTLWMRPLSSINFQGTRTIGCLLLRKSSPWRRCKDSTSSQMLSSKLSSTRNMSSKETEFSTSTTLLEIHSQRESLNLRIWFLRINQKASMCSIKVTSLWEAHTDSLTSTSKINSPQHWKSSKNLTKLRNCWSMTSSTGWTCQHSSKMAKS